MGELRFVRSQIKLTTEPPTRQHVACGRAVYKGRMMSHHAEGEPTRLNTVIFDVLLDESD